MLVRVKESLVENFYGFYGTTRRYPGDEFELTDKKDKDDKVFYSAEEQFSDSWMEELESTKRKRRSREEIDADNAMAI